MTEGETGLFIYRYELEEGGLEMITKINQKEVDDYDSPSEERAFEDFSLLGIFASRYNNKLG